MTHLTIVRPDDQAPATEHHDAMRAALEAIIAEGALAVMFTYEITGNRTGCSCVPALACVRQGFTSWITEDRGE